MLRYMEVLLATHPSKQRRCFQSLNIHASGIGLLQRCSSLESWHAHCVSLLILKLRPSCYHKKDLNRNEGTGLLTSEVSTAIFAFHKELQSQLLGHKLGLVETVIEHWCLHRALYKHRSFRYHPPNHCIIVCAIHAIHAFALHATEPNS